MIQTTAASSSADFLPSPSFFIISIPATAQPENVYGNEKKILYFPRRARSQTDAGPPWDYFGVRALPGA